MASRHRRGYGCETLNDIGELFGPAIAVLVDGLTDPPHFVSLPLERRKPMQAERLKQKCNGVKLIKICDQLSNVMRIVNDPPTDWDYSSNLQYTIGARQVSEICRGIHSDLDKLFDNAYTKAIEKYGDIK